MTQVAIVIKIRNITTFEVKNQIIPIIKNNESEAKLPKKSLQILMEKVSIYIPDYNDSIVVLDMNLVMNVIQNLYSEGWYPNDRKLLQQGGLYFSKYKFLNSPPDYCHSHNYEFEIESICYQDIRVLSDNLLLDEFSN